MWKFLILIVSVYSAGTKLGDFNECNEAILARAQKLFEDNLLQFIPHVSKKKIKQKVVTFQNCIFKTDLPKEQRIKFDLTLGNESCAFELSYPYYRSKLVLKNKDKLIEQAKKCAFHPSPELAAVGKRKKKAKVEPEPKQVPCNQKEANNFLDVFVDYIDVSVVNTHMFQVSTCQYADKDGRKVQLKVTDVHKKEVTVNMHFTNLGQIPNVATEPESYVDELQDLEVEPNFPAEFTTNKKSCDPNKLAIYLEDFVGLLQNPYINEFDFFIKDCTVQIQEGTIVNLDLTGPLNRDIGVSIFTPKFSEGKTAKFASDEVASFLQSYDPSSMNHENLAKLETQEEIGHQDILLQQKTGEQGKKGGMPGGWTEDLDCSAQVLDFEKFLGVERGYFKDSRGVKCRSQVVAGTNFDFKLEDDGQPIKVRAFYPLGNKPPQFTVFPANYISSIKEKQGRESTCTLPDLRKIADAFGTLSNSKSFISDLCFVENITSCKSSQSSYDVSFSFDGKVCDAKIKKAEGKLTLSENSCGSIVLLV